MTFAEKLKRLTEDRRQTVLCKRAGLPSTTIANYLSKQQTPRSDRALALAKVLGVSLDWLVDDKQEWPPVRVASTQIVEQYANQNIAA